MAMIWLKDCACKFVAQPRTVVAGTSDYTFHNRLACQLKVQLDCFPPFVLNHYGHLNLLDCLGVAHG